MKARLKQNTWEHKACVIKSKILPYFGEKSMKDIQARDVLTWQNELLRHRDKNGKRTAYRFKKLVRVIKSMREELKSAGYSVPSEISSFGLESLLWNVSDSAFNKHSSLMVGFDEILDWLVDNIDNFSSFDEANGIKPLFTSSGMLSAYQQFVRDLRKFYQYAA